MTDRKDGEAGGRCVTHPLGCPLQDEVHCSMPLPQPVAARPVAECWTCGKGKPAALYARSDIYMHGGSGHDVRVKP